VKQRLQKFLAVHGYGSRREIERWIVAGRLSVNGEQATLGVKVDTTDRIQLDQKRLQFSKQAFKRRVIIYNKPEGEVCTRSDTEGRKTVFDRLPVKNSERWIAVGRLDMNTSGLLMFTNDGELANGLMHPSRKVDREYAVRINGEVTDEMIQKLKEGVLLEDGMARFTDVQRGKDATGTNQWFYVVLMEGRNREVRRLWEAMGVRVSRLKRVRYGNVFIPSRLKAGKYEELSEKDVANLSTLIDM